MDLDVVLELRLYQSEDGVFWTSHARYSTFWQDYLSVFDKVNIVARVQKVKIPNVDWKQIESECVTVYPLPYYVGPSQFLFKIPALVKALYRRRKVQRAVIYRIPGILSWLYGFIALPSTKAFGVEVVGDPKVVFSKDASTHPLRSFFRFLFVRMQERQCWNASSISYVTETTLQRSYPSQPEAFNTYYSSIKLMPEDFKSPVNKIFTEYLKLICIGSLEQPYKGCDFMLLLLSHLKKKKIKVTLTWIGGGALLSQMQELAIKLNVNEMVRFLGNVAERKVISAELDDSDIFVLSSRTEGLPRVLIEAMARSLVCVATNVGGVTELLPDKAIFEPDNIEQLTVQLQRIRQMTRKERMLEVTHNFERASNYECLKLAVRRKQMYEALKEASR